MPESMNLGGPEAVRSVIDVFYASLFDKDAERLVEIVDEHFASGAVVYRPESLPGGGRLEGADAIKKFLVGSTQLEGGPLDVSEMKVAQVIEGDGFVVELQFPFAGESSSALELWEVDEDGLVVSIQAYYWDTAAMLAASS